MTLPRTSSRADRGPASSSPCRAAPYDSASSDREVSGGLNPEPRQGGAVTPATSLTVGETVAGAMRFAYADPPYLGCGHRYADKHEQAMIWDDPETHRALIERLSDEYKDGWALSLHEPSLRVILPLCPSASRVAAWVKPFASFKPNVTRAWTWEPVIFFGGRKIGREQQTWRDHISAPITMRKGLTGAKPPAFCHWVLDGLNYQPGDALDDLFPGTGIMGEVVAARDGCDLQIGLFSEAAQ